MVPPYIIAHMKVISLLKKHNHDTHNVNIYLTNTLGSAEDMDIDILGALAQEVKKSSTTKSKTPIMVVIGNPPWSAINKTKLDTKFINDKMYTYKTVSVPGTHSLADPYVMFMRFAQYKIEQNGSGVVGMIVNNSFLNKEGFESMRRALAQAFDKIMIYNLHGNSKINRDDSNIFDITTPNTIIILVKLPKELQPDVKICTISYDEIFGSRQSKFKSLQSGKNHWKTLHPENTKQFLFIPYQENKLYEKGFSLDQIFLESFTGSNTHRDGFVVALNKKTIENRIMDFIDAYISDEELLSKYDFGSKFNLRKSRAQAKREGFQEKLIRSYAYRPFDFRYAYFSKHIMGARREQYDDVVGTLSICAPKLSDSDPWTAIHIAKGMADLKFCEYKTPTHMFPLKLPSQSSYGTQLDGNNSNSDSKLGVCNFTDNFIHFIARKYGNEITGESIFYYIYGILHSPLYRIKYSQYLKQSFPKIPFFDKYNSSSGDVSLLLKISKYGQELVNYHTMTKTIKLSYDRIEWIHSNTEYKKTMVVDNGEMVNVSFKNYTVKNIPSNIWNYSIGSRIILKEIINKRFLKKSEIKLTDKQYFLKVCGNIAKTIKIQQSIDQLLETNLSKRGNE